MTNPTLPEKIDSILNQMYTTFEKDGVFDEATTKTALLEAFREAVLEVISKYEPAEFGKSHRPSDVIGLDNTRTRNQLREEQRHRLNQILGESNG